MERLEVGRPKNRIVEKLLVMGLVQDKKELRKKRVGKSREVRGEFCNFIKLIFSLEGWRKYFPLYSHNPEEIHYDNERNVELALFLNLILFCSNSIFR